MNYQEFSKIVPKETKSFVDAILPYLSFYSVDGRYLSFKSDETTSYYYDKMFFILLAGFSRYDEYSGVLEKNGFDLTKFRFNKNINKEIDLEEAFKYIVPFIPELDDVLDYQRLYPVDIVLKSLDFYSDTNYDKDICKMLLPRIESLKSLKRQLQKVNETKINLLDQELEKNMYGNLNIGVVNYIETASKIRNLLRKDLEKDGGEIYRKNDKDLIPLSLLLAVYSYKDIPSFEDSKITEKDALKLFLENYGVTLNNLKRNLNIDYNENNLNTNKNLLVIDEYYKRYFNDLVISGIKSEDIIVSDILQEAFRRDYTDSYALDKLLARLGVNTNSFDNLKEKIVKIREDLRNNASMQNIKDFYNNLTKETKDFIEFTAKTYQLILQKKQQKQGNSKFLNNEDDADTLALYIANCYYNGDVNKFFLEYGVSLKKVLSLLELDISKEEIENVKLDQKVLVDRFKRFVYQGVNEGKNAKDIKAQDIVYNLCDRNFNKSLIMENIFDSLTDKVDLEMDFLTQLKEALEKQELKRRRNLLQKLFYDMDVAVINFLEKVTIFHKQIRNFNPTLEEEEIQNYALILSGLEEKDFSDFLEYIGFNKESICNYLHIRHTIRDNDIDIDILRKYYGKYIFGGINKNKKQAEITIKSIMENAFNKEINNSVAYRKFLNYFHYDNSKIDNFNVLKEKYDKEKDLKEKREKIRQFILGYNYSVTDLIILTLKIHQRLKDNLTEDIILKTDDDIAEAALILALSYKDQDYFKFFKLRNLDREKILVNLGFNKDVLDSVNNDDVCYDLFPLIYAKYFKDDYPNKNSNIDIHELFKRVFDDNINNSLVLETLVAKLDVDYEKLKKEIIMGVAYELTLSMNDRINLLSMAAVDSIDIDDTESMLKFGDSLTVHSKYINNEYPKISMSDAHEEIITKINQIVNRIYVKEDVASKKENFWRRFFTVEPISKTEAKINLNEDAIKELLDSIDRNIVVLREEYKQYTDIRRYMEAYRKKNNLHHTKALEIIGKLEEKIKTLDPNDDLNYSEILVLDVSLDHMKEKDKRFMTTDLLMKQNLVSVMQAIKSHNLTINTLEMARDVLVPLVVAQLSITKGHETEKLGMKLSQDIFSLFQAMLTRNMSDTQENLERLKDSLISSETYKLLTDNIKTYLEDLQNNDVLEEKKKDYLETETKNSKVYLKKFE